jgi:hypothetical protein
MKNTTKYCFILSLQRWQKYWSSHLAKIWYSFTVVVVHRKCVQWSQKSHCNAFWLLFTGCLHFVQGYRMGPGL